MESELKRVLLVGHEPALAQCVEEKLRGIGYEVTPVADAIVAASRAQHENFDLYIFDEQQKAGTGLELCRAFRSFDTATPVLLFGTSADPAAFQTALQAGAQWLLKKPVEAHQLISTAVRLVCQAAPQLLSQRAVQETHKAMQTPSLKVVIADDSALLREGLARLLATVEDVELVGQAADGIAALQLAQTLRPDALILDLRMPGRNGVEVLQDVRREGWPVAVIVLTSFPYPQYRERCLAAGADYFFDKAEAFEQISTVLRQLRARLLMSGPLTGGTPAAAASAG